MKYILAITLLTLIGCSSAHKVEKDRKVIELVIWKPIKGQNNSEVLKKAKSVNTFLKSQKGFIFRDLAKNEKGEWLDFVYWDSLENAQIASKAAQKSKLCQPFFSIIDMKSMKFYHFKSQARYSK